MKLIIIISLLFLINHEVSFAQKNKVVFTIDDLPVVGYSYSSMEHYQEVTDKLIATFSKYDIPAIGFVNENKLYSNNILDSLKVNLLKEWLKNGYDLGNHSFSHKSYHKTSFEEYTSDILQGENICKQLVKNYGKEFNYYRHPFLHIGLSRYAYDSLNNFLGDHGYIEAPVTIDNDDYKFAHAYHFAMQNEDEALMEKIGQEYIIYMEKKLLFYKGRSEALFGRNISHSLLLHANALNADYLDELAEMYLKHHYTFVSMEEALKDSAYQSEIATFGSYGISWIDRWALSKEMEKGFLKDDPTTPEFIEAILKK